MALACWAPDALYSSTAQKIKFSIKDFYSKCDQIRSFLRIKSHLLKTSLMENFIFCAVLSSLRSIKNMNTSFRVTKSFNTFKILILRCAKYLSFTKFPGVEVLWKDRVSAEFPQNFQTRKLIKITVFYAVLNTTCISVLFHWIEYLRKFWKDVLPWNFLEILAKIGAQTFNKLLLKYYLLMKIFTCHQLRDKH